MNNYLVTYDLHSPNQNYDVLIGEIKKFPHWARVNGSVWYVKSSLSLMQITQHFEKFVDSNDVIFVAQMENCAWTNSLDQEVQDYLVNCWNV